MVISESCTRGIENLGKVPMLEQIVTLLTATDVISLNHFFGRRFITWLRLHRLCSTGLNSQMHEHSHPGPTKLCIAISSQEIVSTGGLLSH